MDSGNTNKTARPSVGLSVDPELAATDWGRLGCKPSSGRVRLRLMKALNEPGNRTSDEYALVRVPDTYEVS